MVWFDRRHQKLVVRIVYDGPAFAGKTTNVRQLCEAFTRQRRSELYCPEEVDGRTQLFDWLTLDAGLVGGYGLRCHMMTVPGQARLAQRRWKLVTTADVLVFVCESTERGVRDGRISLELLRARLLAARRNPTLILQANKQDLPGALDPGELGRQLGLPHETARVPSRAAEGAGVRETAVVAIRAAADAAQRALLAGGVDALEDDVDDPQEEASSLRALSPLPIRRGVRGLARREPVRAAVATASELTSQQAPAPPSFGEPAVEPETETPPRGALPPLPCATVASGHIWPAATGREVLRALDAHPSRSRCIWRSDEESGRISVEVGPLVLTTAAARRYADVDEARNALLREAREAMRTSVAPSPMGRTLCLVPEAGTYWLWTIEQVTTREA